MMTSKETTDLLDMSYYICYASFQKQKAASSSVAPVIDLKKNDINSEYHFNMLTGRVSKISS